MSAILAALASGILFALGLGVAGMTQPGKVTAFLDFAGTWDPSLAFVMIGAIAVYAIGSRLVLRRRQPVLADRFQIPANRKLDGRLFLGAALFGVGWGLAGFCPGPALVSLSSLQTASLLFVVAMLIGILLGGKIPTRTA